MLTTHQLLYAYAGRPAMQFPDLACAPGEHWLVLGQSGSGKTTLLHLLGGLLTPTAGQVNLLGTDYAALSGPALDRFRGRHIGLVFQRAHFVAALSVEENLLLAQRLAGLAPSRSRVAQLLERLQVGRHAQRPVHRLSMGEQQRVAIARALVNQPALILADEPTSALDDDNSARVVQLLEEEARAVNATLLIVTHDNRLKDHFTRRVALNPQTIPA